MTPIDQIRKALEHYSAADFGYDQAEALSRLHRILSPSAVAALSRMGGEAVPGKYDDVLRPFVALMERELHANSAKGDRPGWLKIDANTALLEIYWHAAKLSAAVKNNDGDRITEHAADVANMAMMLLDVCGGLAAPTAPAQQAAPRDDDEATQPWYDLAWECGASASKNFAGDDLEALTFSPGEFEKFCAALSGQQAADVQGEPLRCDGCGKTIAEHDPLLNCPAAAQSVLKGGADQLREALEFYANAERYAYDETCCFDGSADGGVLDDHGERARTALAASAPMVGGLADAVREARENPGKRVRIPADTQAAFRSALAAQEPSAAAEPVKGDTLGFGLSSIGARSTARQRLGIEWGGGRRLVAAAEPVACRHGHMRCLACMNNRPPTPPSAPAVPSETPPLDSLPSWDECALRVANSNHVEKRVREGGHGADHDVKLANNLHRFIYEYEDQDPYRAAWFRHRLELALADASAVAGEGERQYVACRECADCNHVGINDDPPTRATCGACDWSGDSPREDKCPDCNKVGTMGAACPKCGGRYRLLAETTLRPSAPPSHEGPDARDAARYRQLRDQETVTHGVPFIGFARTVFDFEGKQLTGVAADAAIDAARAGGSQ